MKLKKVDFNLTALFYITEAHPTCRNIFSNCIKFIYYTRKLIKLQVIKLSSKK
jgi:hypothetical protein